MACLVCGTDFDRGGRDQPAEYCTCGMNLTMTDLRENPDLPPLAFLRAEWQAKQDAPAPEETEA